MWNLEKWWEHRWSYRLPTQTPNTDRWALGQPDIVSLVRTLAGDPVLLICDCVFQWANTMNVNAIAATSTRLWGLTLISSFSLPHLYVLNHILSLCKPTPLYSLYLHITSNSDKQSHTLCLCSHICSFPWSCLAISYYANLRPTNTHTIEEPVGKRSGCVVGWQHH